MHKNKYYKAPKPSTLPQKQSTRPRPEWTTDFTEPNKYKLSETEMIQRKAALQSKNREIARQDLQQRRRKLQMGIIDEDTRKVYETALTSKKIDLNPSIRKNLSQMIHYEKQRQDEKLKNCQEENNQEESDQSDYEEEIKKTSKFIKKLERAKKQDRIQKAVEIMMDQRKSSHFGPTKNVPSPENSSSRPQTLKNTWLSNEDKSISRQQTLSNIEDTIKFMQEKLFNKNWNKKEQKHIENAEAVFKQKKHEKNATAFDQADENEPSHLEKDISFNQFLSQDFECKASSKINFSQLKINLSDNADEQDECMSTIRRMREMIESKEELYCPQPIRQKQNWNTENLRGFSTIEKLSCGEAEVDFSLTMTEDDPSLKIENDLGFHKSSKLEGYEQLKKNLFEEVEKIQNYGFNEPESKQYSSYALSNSYNNHSQDQSSIGFTSEPVMKKKKVRQPNPDLEHIKNLVEGTRDNVQRIQIEPIGHGKGMIGFDYRGSINIKKNIIKNT